MGLPRNTIRRLTKKGRRVQVGLVRKGVQYQQDITILTGGEVLIISMRNLNLYRGGENITACLTVAGDLDIHTTTVTTLLYILTTVTTLQYITTIVITLHVLITTSTTTTTTSLCHTENIYPEK